MQLAMATALRVMMAHLVPCGRNSMPRCAVNLNEGSSSHFLPPLPDLHSQDLASTHSFSAAANWLIPGRILLGANPTKGRGSSLDRVMAVCCDGGCTTLVSLQAELPPMDSPEFINEPSSYAIDARAVSSVPPNFVHRPIDDLQPAGSVEWLAAAVDDLADRVLRGETLYIHCFAGR